MPSPALRFCAALLFVLALPACARGADAPLDAAAGAAPATEAAGAVATGRYPDLFTETGYDSDAVQAKVQAAFTQLFHGDPREQAVYYETGRNARGPLAYIHDVNSGDVRSEGMSYGMMIAVQLDRKHEFDAIWNWATTHMYQDDPAHPAYGYFAWSVSTDGVPNDEMPAPDGEEYFITALYFASARWGEGEGIHAYRAQADRLLADILHRGQISGATVTNPKATATNLFDRQAKMVRFTPDLPNARHTDASYHLPAFYEVWARVGPQADRAFWHEAAQVSRDYFAKAAHPRTALTPDYGNFDGTPWAAPWRPEAVDFRYDAWRTAMNWSMDWSWWRADPRQVELSNRLQAFFRSQGMDRYQSLYTLKGKPLGGGQTTGLVAMNAVSSLAADDPRRLEFVRALWERPVPEGHHRYYDGMLYLMALLHCSGQYRAWIPEPQAP
ncbi:glycoside hydrolase [Pseudoxanthomonas broegbernensis]|uniref:cellulase n=1 Tax=Pseudoxanthomonas broegbernensis TaxID=83619 RepID=A0A7V8K8N7_9GAMM|nr:glycosyl hydrolase family 8 [Pseudoxanthomonas broegbernensis]KAF1688022.1 glycoside hydrolase [Pseudoxanthomonas broegbernensis]MBB6065045.1 oligosaccharide reducing-end xylanase [Pseudoxanthomonas broegbernensis]